MDPPDLLIGRCLREDDLLGAESRAHRKGAELDRGLPHRWSAGRSPQGARALFERHWSRLRFDNAPDWIRDLAAGAVDHLELRRATFSLTGRAKGPGFEWTYKRRFPDVDAFVWQAVRHWPAEERDAICVEPDRDLRRDHHR